MLTTVGSMAGISVGTGAMEAVWVGWLVRIGGTSSIPTVSSTASEAATLMATVRTEMRRR